MSLDKEGGKKDKDYHPHPWTKRNKEAGEKDKDEPRNNTHRLPHHKTKKEETCGRLITSGYSSKREPISRSSVAHESLISRSWVAHQSLISRSWVAHQSLISHSSVAHQLPISRSSVAHQSLISCSSVAHQLLRSWLLSVFRLFNYCQPPKEFFV